MAKKMILKGVGSFMAKVASADGKGVEVITLGSLQDLKITLDVQLEDIFGGDGLFAIDTLVKQKSIEVSATDAKLDLAALTLMLGSKVRDGVVNDSVWVLGEQESAVAGTIGTNVNVGLAPVAFGATLFGSGNFAIRLKDSNKLLKLAPVSATIAPTDEEFFIKLTPADGSATPPTPATADIIVSPTHVGKDLIYNYQRTEVVDIVDILAEEVPFPVHIVHHGSFLQKDGTFAGVETELYQCRAKGSFTIDAARATASTSSVTLQVLDPERTDGKLGQIKRFQSAKKV